ncbi:MAG: hypothetical protein ACFFAS_03340 [Promethearchaeota archaeon]
MIDDEDDEAILNKKTSPKMVLKTLFVILLVVIGAFIIYIGIFPENQVLNFGLGFIVICLGTSIIQMPSEPPEPVRQTLTILICERCSAKKVRDYKDGDFVYKKMDECNKCGVAMSIKQIYSVKLKQSPEKKSKEKQDEN